MKNLTPKPQRINASEIASVAAQGVNRALAARESCLRELTPQELADVSGGATVSVLISKGILAGGRRLNDFAATLGSGMTAPTLDAGSLATGMTGMV